MKIFNFFKTKSQPDTKTIEFSSPVYDYSMEERIKYFNAKPTPVTLHLEIFADEPIDIYFHIAKEKAELILSDLLTVLHKIDAIVQQSPNTEFEIGYIDIYDDNIQICYYGLLCNTEFDVKVYKDAEQWYVSKQGLRTYNPPKRIY